jgi:hypothetical protein
MSEYWFKPHDHGYGVTPTSWKGWAAVAVYAAIMLALALSLASLPADMPRGPGAWQLATWLIMVGVLTLGFLRLCRAKTDGEWRWRWGNQR